MSNEKQETIADIAAKLRDGAADIAKNYSIVPIRREDQEADVAFLRRLADRIEVAWKREREGAERRGSQATMAEVCKTLEAVRSELDPGNVAAMREALETLTDSACDYIAKGLVQLPLSLDEVCKWSRAALAAPVRNCDRFTTRKEARAAYEALRPRPRWKEGDGLPAFSVVRFDEWVWLPPREDGLYMRQEYEPTLFDQGTAEGATESGVK